MKRAVFPCPHCGADVRAGAKVCKVCGSDAETGWQDEEEIVYQSLDIPDGWGPEPDGERRVGPGRLALWKLVAVVVALAMVAVALRVLWW